MIPPKVNKRSLARADQFNSLRDFLISLGVDVEWPLRWKPTGSNARLSVDQPDEFWARITANLGAGLYEWKELTFTLASAWVDHGRTGTSPLDVAQEANDVATIPVGTRVYMRRQQNGGIVVFQEDTCA